MCIRDRDGACAVPLDIMDACCEGIRHNMEHLKEI